jgi:hypothetical protein
MFGQNTLHLVAIKQVNNKIMWYNLRRSPARTENVNTHANRNPDDYLPEEEEEFPGAVTDPLANPPGSHGRKAPNPYEGNEPNDLPGPSLNEQMDDSTPANDAELGGGEEL